MSNSKMRLALAGAAAVLTVSLATPAMAGTGCNGVVNLLKWGCAPWDNNNGPQFPYYKKKTIVIPKKGAEVKVYDGRQMVMYNGAYHPVVGLIGQDGASMVGGRIIGNDAGSFKVSVPQ